MVKAFEQSHFGGCVLTMKYIFLILHNIFTSGFILFGPKYVLNLAKPKDGQS